MNKNAARLIECSVCLDNFKHPKLLPCSHTYCLECLNTLAGTKADFQCPECKAETTVPERGVQAFPDNRYLGPLLDKTYCMKHQLPLDLFCQEAKCEALVCSTCVAAAHTGHRVNDLVEQKNEARKTLMSLKKSLGKMSERCNNNLDDLNELGRETKENETLNVERLQAAKRKFDEDLENLKQKVYAQIESQEASISRKRQRNETKIDELAKKIEKREEDLDNLGKDIEDVLESSSDYDLIRSVQDFRKSYEHLKAKEKRDASGTTLEAPVYFQTGNLGEEFKSVSIVSFKLSTREISFRK